MWVGLTTSGSTDRCQQSEIETHGLSDDSEPRLHLSQDIEVGHRL